LDSNVGSHARSRRGYAVRLDRIASIEHASRKAGPGLVDVLDALVEAVIIFAPDGAIKFANRAARAWLGTGSQGSLEGESVESLLAPWRLSDENVNEVPPARLLAAAAGGPPFRAVHRESGELRWWHASCQPLSVGDADDHTQLLVLEDITAVKETEVRMRVLAESGRALLESLDFEQRLENLAHMPIPMADWAGVYLTDEALNLRRVIIAHRSPSGRALAEGIRRMTGDRVDPASELGRVIRTGRSILLESVSGEHLARRARTAEQLRLLQRMGLRSAVVAPLRAPDRILGGIVLATADSRRRLTEEDLELAEQLGQRAAIALEHSRLHRQVSEVAETLAQSFLPPRLPEVPGWEVATLYKPIVSELRIELGGDFLDMLAVGSSWFAVIGDIEGKGVLAATVSGLMRHGTRLAAQQRPSPAAVLEQLDEALKSYPSDVTATMLCARLGESELTVASAGHPPPLVTNLDGETRELRTRGPMLGAFPDGEWRDQAFAVNTGELVLCYTDGITEALGGRKSLGRDRLRMLLSWQAGRRPADVLDALDRALGDVNVRDDLAALAMRRR
jgi:serine phosphatase RsbU (regulator of sigma subunit)